MKKKQLLKSKDFNENENIKDHNIKLPTQKVYNINFTIGEFIMQLNQLSIIKLTRDTVVRDLKMQVLTGLRYSTKRCIRRL